METILLSETWVAQFLHAGQSAFSCQCPLRSLAHNGDTSTSSLAIAMVTQLYLHACVHAYVYASVHAQLFSRVRLFATHRLWPSRVFSLWDYPCGKYWSGLPFPSQKDLPKPHPQWLLYWQVDSLPLSHLESSTHTWTLMKPTRCLAKLPSTAWVHPLQSALLQKATKLPQSS